jgi:hypothetical protein
MLLSDDSGIVLCLRTCCVTMSVCLVPYSSCEVLCHNIEILCLPLQVLRSLDGTVCKPQDCSYHQQATAFVRSILQASVNKSKFGRLFSATWYKSEIFDSALKGVKCTGLYRYNSRAISDDNPFTPSTTLLYFIVFLLLPFLLEHGVSVKHRFTSVS